MGGHASILFLRGKQALSAKKTAHTPDLDVNPTTAIAVVLILPEVREFNTKPILTNTTRGLGGGRAIRRLQHYTAPPSSRTASGDRLVGGRPQAPARFGGG